VVVVTIESSDSIHRSSPPNEERAEKEREREREERERESERKETCMLVTRACLQR
jgi:hypothetical protein